MDMGGVLNHYEYGTMGYNLFWLIESFCMVSVNAFVLITGYYGIKSNFRLSRVLRFYLEVLAFSVLVTFVANLYSDESVGIAEWVYAIFPLTSKRYWFASNYALLIFIQPLLNVLIRNIDEQTHKICIVVLLVLFSVLPSFLLWNREVTGTGMDVIWFSILYIVGAYIHNYGLLFIKVKWSICYLLLSTELFVSELVIPGLSKALIGRTAGIGVFNYYNNVFVFCASVAFFMIFIANKNSDKQEDDKLLKKLASIGGYVFGAYLISDHRAIRSLLWERIDIMGISDNPMMVLFYVLLVNVSVFIAGVILDCLIKNIITSKMINNVMNKIDFRVNRLLQ